MRSQIETAAFGLYSSDIDLQSLAADLSRAGVPHQDVCVVLPASHPAAKALRPLKTGACTHSAVSQVQQALDWLAKFGAAVIPGVGVFVAGQSFVGTLFGPSNDERACNRILANLGVSQPDAERYAEWVNLGGTVVYATCEDAARVQSACEVLHQAGAAQVSWPNDPDLYCKDGFQHLLHAC